MTLHTLVTDTPFLFEAGGSLDSITVAYHCSDTPYTPDKKVVWICHALTANSDPQEWWPGLVGEGKTLDPDKYFIVCVNMLTSPYGSSGPASINPATGKPFYFDFPQTTIRDMINASILVRKALGIEAIDLLVGSSIGGFQAGEWCIMEPDVIKNALILATSMRETPWLGASCETQRMALEADPTFREAKSLQGGALGLECARAQALMSYRCFTGYQLSQEEQDVDCLFSGRAASYQKYQGHKLVRRGFDAYSYYYLCQALDSHNVGRGRGGVEKAISTIKSRCIVGVIDSDVLFPVEDYNLWKDYFIGAEQVTLTSLYGHDGFLLEYDQLIPLVEKLLK